MAKKITFGLSVSEIQEAIKQIEAYQSEINSKCELFVRKLAQEGVSTANAILRQGKEEDYVPSTNVQFEIDPKGNIISAKIIASGSHILYLEFGSGIRYSSAKNPKADELGYGAGTYPSDAPQQNPPYDNWKSPTGWYYYGEDGKLHHTYGVKATMPMYNTSLDMANKVVKIAREAFKS